MKHFYFLAAAMLMAGSAAAQSTVSISDLRGSYVFRGQANDWTGYGLTPPSISTVTLSVNEEDNTVSMTGFLGANVAIWGDDDDPVYGSLSGVFNPETQVMTFKGSDDSEIFFTLQDDYYDWYIYDLCLKATRDEEGNVVLDMVASENGSLCVIQTYYYDNDANDYVYPSYGYDQGGQAIQLSSTATSLIGTLEPGSYTLCYTDSYGVEASCDATVTADADGLLSLAIGKGVVGLNAQTSGRGSNKFTYAYVTEGCWYTQNIYWWGTGDYDYDSYLCPEYWGQSEATLYFNGDGTMSFNTGLWLGSEDVCIAAYNPVLRPNTGDGISDVRANDAATISFDLMGRRTDATRGFMIRGNKIVFVK